MAKIRTTSTAAAASKFVTRDDLEQSLAGLGKQLLAALQTAQQPVFNADTRPDDASPVDPDTIADDTVFVNGVPQADLAGNALRLKGAVASPIGPGLTEIQNRHTADAIETIVEVNEYPATFRKLNAKTGLEESRGYAVKPVDRKLFIETLKRLPIGGNVTISTADKAGRLTASSFPLTGAISGKRFSSGNHGLFGQVGCTVTLPNGTEYELRGMVTLLLTKRTR